MTAPSPFECAICHQLYNDQENVPTTFPCGHSCCFRHVQASKQSVLGYLNVTLETESVPTRLYDRKKRSKKQHKRAMQTMDRKEKLQKCHICYADLPMVLTPSIALRDAAMTFASTTANFNQADVNTSKFDCNELTMWMYE